jgi:hypothetical protein
VARILLIIAYYRLLFCVLSSCPSPLCQDSLTHSLFGACIPRFPRCATRHAHRARPRAHHPSCSCSQRSISDGPLHCALPLIALADADESQLPEEEEAPGREPPGRPGCVAAAFASLRWAVGSGKARAQARGAGALSVMSKTTEGGI